ncbi:hypothetical protein DXG01_013713 [Tephrocybe rancida]|nr:hypothetical protein DXG01_013713 [Tephrocybe rancida]
MLATFTRHRLSRLSAATPFVLRRACTFQGRSRKYSTQEKSVLTGNSQGEIVKAPQQTVTEGLGPLLHILSASVDNGEPWDLNTIKLAKQVTRKINSKIKSTQNPNETSSPLHPNHPARLTVLADGGNALLDAERLEPRVVVNLINQRLAAHEDSKHLVVASAAYNSKQNLVLIMLQDQTALQLKEHADKFTDVFGIPVRLLPANQYWKLFVHGVWTGHPDHVHSVEELLAELQRFNPIMSGDVLSQPPRWLKPDATSGKERSTVVLTFKHHSDVAQVLKMGYLAMYGRGCRVGKNLRVPTPSTGDMPTVSGSSVHIKSAEEETTASA